MQQLSEYTNVLKVTAGGLNLTLHRAGNLEELWDKMTKEDFGEDERLPYWTELWPASLVLSDWLKQNAAHIANQPCLDLGCGLGLTALVAASCQARVIGMDYEEIALRYAKKNAVENDLDSVTWTCMDWRTPALRPHSLSYVWGGDIIYERRFVSPVLDFLEHSLKPDGRAWLAEPSREDVFSLFRQALAHRGWLHRLVHEQKIPAIYAQPMPVNVRLWELRKPSGD